VLAPDGLPARITGGWVWRKVHYVDYYVDMFATAMRQRWTLAYVEPFAGPGMAAHGGSFIEGSALRALEKPFSSYFFIDSDPIAIGALQLRIRRKYGWPPRGAVIQGDCNDALPEVAHAISPSTLSLAFIDPNGWEIQWSTIASFVRERRVDLLFTFHAGFMRRQWYADAPSLTAFFGNDDWRAIEFAPRHDRIRQLVRLYNEGLDTLGYLPGAEDHLVSVRNGKGTLMYVLVLFTRSELGQRFWASACQTTPLTPTGLAQTKLDL
jgi:three-Cys-motif partner protein